MPEKWAWRFRLARHVHRIKICWQRWNTLVLLNLIYLNLSTLTMKCWKHGLPAVAAKVEQTIFGCVQWVDPQLIVLGGIMPKPILNRLVEEIAPKLQITLDANRPHVSLGISSRGAHSASHGAAMIPLYQFINEE